MIPGNQVNQESQVKVSLSDAETIKCKDCNNYLWIQSFILKKNIRFSITKWKRCTRTCTSL